MITCLIVAAVVTCSNVPPKPAPADAARVLTSSVRPWTPPAPKREVWRDFALLSIPAPSGTNGMPAPTPTRPLSSPWRVTTVVTPDRGVQTWFNGERVR
jgi:hypothetical protein